MKKVVLLSILITIVTIQQAWAQNEIARERSSLRGIQEFGIVVNIEHSIDLQHEVLNVTSIRKAIERNFEELPITILGDKTLRQSDEFPIFHFHLNVMKASNNTYPFSIEMNFYQPVKLVLNRDLKTMASTWNRGQIGIVTLDMMHIIEEEVIYASNLFKNEFIEVN